MPQNYKNRVDWVARTYNDAGIDLSNGFQKDDIQNHQGARPMANRWDDWKCDISVIENEDGTYLVCEDAGTVGLTGQNMSVSEIDEKVANDEKFEAVERLARFSSMNISGDNQLGGGLYGVGKTVYAFASNDYTYYFDSLREDGKYVANINDTGRIIETALEGEEAKDFIKRETGFDDKKTIGTRVIIKNPKKELIDSINSGEMLKHIQESWWLIMGRLPDTAGISVNGEKVNVPSDIKNTKYKFELKGTDLYKKGYRVKNFGFYLFEDGDNRWSGVSYYRKGMKIGEVDIKCVPDNLRGKYWGYIEVDEPWENELADIEDAVHFGVSKHKKNRLQYQLLKNYCNEKIESLLKEWKFIKEKENTDEKLKEELRQIAEEVQDLFDELKFEDLGKGPQKPDFDIRWNGIEYPSDSLTVTSGDHIKFKIRITSNYSTDKEFEYSVVVFDQYSQKIVSEIDAQKILIQPQETKEVPYEYIVDKETASRYNENRILLRVKVIGSGKTKEKMLPFFFDCEKPLDFKENVILTLHNCSFPNQGSKRVNYGEKLTDIEYRIDNKRNAELYYQLSVSVHNVLDDRTAPKIEDIITIKGTVKPYEEIVIKDIPDIVFDEELYSQYLTSGTLQLRARLSASEDSGEMRQGDRITNYYFNFYLNTDEKNGKRDSFDVRSIDKSDKKSRSWITKEGDRRYIDLNLGHAAYLQLEDYPDLQHSYMREQVIKQYVLLYLSEGKYNTFDKSDKEFTEMDPVTASDRVIEKIEEVLYDSLTKA